MRNVILVTATLVAALFVAPVVESSYSVTSIFQAVGTACDGGGGGW
jgi:hypothetical protein